VDYLEALATQLWTQILSWGQDLDWSEVAVGTLFFLVVFIARRQISKTLYTFLAHVAQAIRIPLNSVVRRAALPVIRVLIISFPLYGLLGALNLPPLIHQMLEKLVISIVLAAVFAAAYSLVGAVARWVVNAKRGQSNLQIDWLKKILKAIVCVLGLVSVLQVWGVDIGPVLTGMGVLGAGMAIAAQDLFRNLIAGVASMGERRFEIGDWIRVEGVVEGIVEKVELRSTLIRQFDQAAVHVPNADLANTTMKNFTRRNHRQIYWTIQVVYGTTAEQLTKIRDEIRTYVRESDDFVSESEVPTYIYSDSFSDSSVDILIWCYTRTTEFGEYLAVKERLLLEVKRIVEDAGTVFAYPTRTIVSAAGN
jgi:MscS family membrane protein